jgi:hypothetical protein
MRGKKGRLRQNEPRGEGGGKEGRRYKRGGEDHMRTSKEGRRTAQRERAGTALALLGRGRGRGRGREDMRNGGTEKHRDIETKEEGKWKDREEGKGAENRK